MGRLFVRKVSGDPGNIYKCSECMCHVASAENIVSTSFHGRGGRAYLISDVVNVYKGITFLNI